MNKLIEDFSYRLKKALNIRNMKPIELSEKTKISKSKISSYMSGRYKAKQDGVYKLAKALNVNPAWLMGYDAPMENEYFMKNNIKTYGEDYKKNFPILGIVKAGYDYFAEENCIGYITIDKEISDIKNYFALKVTGDSMQPILYENDLVVVHKQDDIENGQVAIILVDGEEATIKKVLKFDDHIELHAFNSYYPPRILKKNDDFKIIGKVVEARISGIFE